MFKFEGVPDTNDIELNSSEPGDVNLSPEISPEEQVENLGGEVEAQQQETTDLTEPNEVIEKPEFLPAEEDSQTEQETLEKQKEELNNQQEKERLIKEEKEKILQERLNALFEEFEALEPRDFENISKSGKISGGHNVESKSMGFLDSETAQSLARTFNKGVKLLPEILENLPELLEKFDKSLTEEATERVEQRLEGEKKKMEEEQENEKKPEEPKSEEKLEVPQGEILTDKVKPGLNPIGSGDIESPGT